MFDANGDGADDRAFADRCKDDRHHFRIIVSPEDAADLTDLREYTRDLVRQMEADLGTRLEWIAVDHWNTDNPHVHLLVRGVDDQGGRPRYQPGVYQPQSALARRGTGLCRTRPQARA
ncbi:relaxase/mobilization nuclease domain-containing protein [Caballeronia sp. CLC5]|uniref:relaxase/mobilization nuclease domain-containing protein n=1 Tax=Caballeronia sp. CLC5 TaxID=2906764 RepID=UPI0035CD2BB8